MTEVNTNVEVAKKARRAPFKIQKTAAEIIAELNKLESEVEELDTALGELQQGSAGYKIVKEAYEKKSAELETAESRVYHA